jgi:hypothetical protein
MRVIKRVAIRLELSADEAVRLKFFLGKLRLEDVKKLTGEPEQACKETYKLTDAIYCSMEDLGV